MPVPDPVERSRQIAAERDTMKAELESMTRERDFWRGEVERLRAAFAGIRQPPQQR